MAPSATASAKASNPPSRSSRTPGCGCSSTGAPFCCKLPLGWYNLRCCPKELKLRSILGFLRIFLSNRGRPIPLRRVTQQLWLFALLLEPLLRWSLVQWQRFQPKPWTWIGLHTSVKDIGTVKYACFKKNKPGSSVRRAALEDLLKRGGLQQ